jgi:hypothetical protein
LGDSLRKLACALARGLKVWQFGSIGVAKEPFLIELEKVFWHVKQPVISDLGSATELEELGLESTIDNQEDDAQKLKSGGPHQAFAARKSSR